MFDKRTWIRLPRNVVVGHDVIHQTADAVADLHLSGRPLVVTSPTANEVAGETVVAELSTLGPDPETVVVESAYIADDESGAHEMGVGLAQRGMGTHHDDRRPDTVYRLGQVARQRGSRRQEGERGQHDVDGSTHCAAGAVRCHSFPPAMIYGMCIAFCSWRCDGHHSPFAASGQASTVAS
jgi:hypothetical protein